MIRVHATGSKGNLYSIHAGNEILLLEAGIRIKSIMKAIDFQLDKVVGCLVSHNHMDHSYSCKSLADEGIKICGPENLIEKLESQGVRGQRTRLVGDKDFFNVGNFKIKAFKNYHKNSDSSPCECLGYLINHKEIGTILFATDTYLIKPVFKNVDHILVECNFNDLDEELEEHDTRRLESHMSLNTLKKLIPRWNLDKTKTITLIHLSDTRADSELMQREIAELTGKKVLIAKKGLIIE